MNQADAADVRPSSSAELAVQADGGDRQALNELLKRHRDRLRRIIRLRLNPRLAGRVDPSDIIQEAYLEAAKGWESYRRDPPLPLFLWLRRLAGQKLVDAHRRHLGAEKRDARRDLSLGHGGLPEATSASLAAQLLGKLTTPSQAFLRADLCRRIQETLDGLEAVDREVLVLRHFEQLTNGEVAQALTLTETAASKRYVRALRRLAAMLGDLDLVME